MSNDQVHLFLALLTVVALGVAIWAVVTLVRARSGAPAAIAVRCDRWYQFLVGAALISATAALGSLALSEILHYEPCLYCWYQRIGMYGTAIILTVAVIRRDAAIKWYAITLATLGSLVSLWHVLYDQIPSLQGTGACDPNNPCSLRWIALWEVSAGHPLITIQSMALVGFLATISLLLLIPSDLGDTNLDDPDFVEPAFDEPAFDDELAGASAARTPTDGVSA